MIIKTENGGFQVEVRKMNDADYFATDAWSAHGSRQCITEPKKWARGDSLSSKELDFGRACHYALLECNDGASFDKKKFAERYRVAPAVNARTKDGKAQLEAFRLECESQNLEVVSQEDYILLEAIVESLQKSKRVQLYLGNVKADGFEVYKEAAVFWTQGTQKCKAKMDCLILNHEKKLAWIIDLKTTTSATPENFAKSCAQYGYGWQAAWYSIPFLALGYKTDFYAVAVEKTRNADFGLYNLREFADAEFQNIMVFLENANFISGKARAMVEMSSGREESVLSRPRWFNGTAVPEYLLPEEEF